MSLRVRRIVAILLLIVGVQLWLLVGRGHWGSNTQLKLLVVEIILAAIPWVNRPVSRVLDRVRAPSPRVRAIVAWCIVPLAAGYFLYTAHWQQRMLYPHVHDERMYLLQARMLATGRLWTAPHPAADSFETFYVIVKPVYAAMYFPGSAMMYAIGLILHLPPVIIPPLIAGAAVAFVYRVMSELVDGLAGALGAIFFVALSQTRYVATMYMSHAVMLLLTLMLLWTWLNWRREGAWGWALALGAVAGWAAITRPIDAICCAIPVGIAILLRLRTLPRRSVFLSLALIIAGAMPFLSLQLLFDYGVTGHLLQTPVTFYDRADAPGVEFGFAKADSNAPRPRPLSQLPQKQALFDHMIRPVVEERASKSVISEWLNDRFPWMSVQLLPGQLLLVILPLGLLAAERKHWVCIAVLPLFIAAYTGFAWLLAHYCLVVAPAVCLLVLLSERTLADTWPRLRAGIATGFTAAMLTLCIAPLPECNRLMRDEWWFHPPVVRWDHDVLPTLVKTPALVLYRFNPGNSPYDEPVYNTETANPDDATIIRAQFLSPEQNRRLFEYYAKTQPQRHVYMVNRTDTLEQQPRELPLRYLGEVGDLVK